MISFARTLLDLQKAIASAIEAARLQAQAASVTNLARANATTNGFQPVRASTALTPYIFPQRNEFAPTAMAPLKLGVGKPEDDAATARGIVDEAVRGKSIDQIAAARGMRPDQVIDALRSGHMDVSVSSNGDVGTTSIKDSTGRTVTQYYDYQHDSYYTSVQEKTGGPATSTPVRDGLGRKETSSYNSDTGAVTTRYEDDLGTGTVTERTSMPNGASVETVTPRGGPSIPVTTVTGPDGTKTTLAPKQKPGGDSTRIITDGLAAGKSIDQIARENNLKPEQITAELQAAGYQVKSVAATSGNGDVQSVEIVDAHTGAKTVYTNDIQHDERTVVTNAGGKETTQWSDGNGRTRETVRTIATGETTTTVVDPKAGTQVKTVTDKDGRVTTTTTEQINGGKPIEYEVKSGDSLGAIAKQYGVTVDDLRRANPQLFSSPGDSVIHPGEKVTVASGSRTTVTVTFNGYTLTTRPDGSMTLHNATTGADLDIKAGSTQAALANTLLAVNPDSSDPEVAKEGQVVKTLVEGILAGEALPSLVELADKAGRDKQALIDKYGLGKPATPKFDGQHRIVDPFGDPPIGNAPSGGKWTPLKIDGVWTWVDPQVAQAIITENIALSRVTETRALAVQRQEQLNVQMLDPAYKGAVAAAQATVNKGLAPLGMSWKVQKPQGTLAEAQNRLTKANTLLQNAQGARAEYENAGRVLNDAIAGNSKLGPLPNPNATYASAQGAPPGPSYAQQVADHAAIDKQFSEVGLHLSKGDKLTIDSLLGEADLNGVAVDSQQYKDLKAMQTAAASQVDLAQAYQNYYDAHDNAAQVGARQDALEQKLLIEYLGKQKFDPNEKVSRYNGDYLGRYQGSTLEIRDGQLWVVNHFEEGTTEQALTYRPDNKNVRNDYRDRPLNKEWQQLLQGDGSNAQQCVANGLTAVKVTEAQAAKDLNSTLDGQLGKSITDLNSKLTALQAEVNKPHKPGTVDAPAGTLTDGAQPVTIDVDGHTIKVSPEVAQAYGLTGLDALTQSGKAVWIDLDTSDGDASGRWVDPELAVAQLSLEATKNKIAQAGDLRRVLHDFNEYHELSLSDPSLLVERNSSVDRAYLDKHQQQTLDVIYKPKFKQLFNSGYDNTFRDQPGNTLETTVGRAFNFDRSTDAGRKASDSVLDEIRGIGGDKVAVRVVPIFYVDSAVGAQQTALIAVRDGDATRYVDATGQKFDDLADFQDNNNQFSESGKLVVPKGLEMKTGADGDIALEVVNARNVSVMDRLVDPLVGVVTGAATILSFTPLAPVAAPVAYAGAGYLGARALVKEVNYLAHGGEWDDGASLGNIAGVVTTVLPVASSLVRTAGLAGKELNALQAFRGSIGATRAGSPLALQTQTYMQSSALLNKTAWHLDVGSVIAGTPLLVTSAFDLAANGNQMNGLQLANAIIGTGTGIVGTGLGIRGLRTFRPGTGEEANPASFDADASPDYTESWTSGPAIGHSGKPMKLLEADADGVFVDTGELVYHDPAFPVIRQDGDDAGGAGEPGTALVPVSRSSTKPEGDAPADSDPIVVPGEVVLANTQRPLIWDPQSRSFTGDPASSDASGSTQATRPLMRYTIGNRHTGETLSDFNLPAGQRTTALPETKAIEAAAKPVPAPVELDPSLPVLYLGDDGRWTTEPVTRQEAETNAVTDTGQPRPVRSDGTPVINRFSSNPLSLGQTFLAIKAGLRRIGTRYLDTAPRYDYPKLGELVDSIYQRPVPEGVAAGQRIYVEADGKYLEATVIIAGPQANIVHGDVVPGEHVTEAGYLGSGSTVERAKRLSMTTPNGQLRVNTPAREVHTFDPADNAEITNRSALGETLAATLPELPGETATPASTWTPEQVELVGDYLHSLERSTDSVLRDAVTTTRLQLGGRGLPEAGTEMTPAQHHALTEILDADQHSVFTGSKPVGQLSMNGVTTLQVFSAQGKLPQVSPAEVIDRLGLSSEGGLPGGEQLLTSGALPAKARWTDAGRDVVRDYVEAAAGATDPNLVAAAKAALPALKGRATKPGKAVTPEQHDALLQVLAADAGGTWVYGPRLQPGRAFSPAGKLSPEGRYNEKVLSGHATWTPHLWREMRAYAANQQKSADPVVQSLAHSLADALPGSKPKAGTEINSTVPVLLQQLRDADSASSWRSPNFFTDAQGVWRSDRATVSWFLQEHESNIIGGPALNSLATNTLGLGGSMFGISVPLPSRQAYGELSLKNNGPSGTGFLLPVHPDDARGQTLFANGYRPNYAYDETAGQWVGAAPMLTKNTYQSEKALGLSVSIGGFSVGGAFVARKLYYLGGEGGRPGYTLRPEGPLSREAASFWEEATRGGASHYSAEGKVPGMDDRVLYRNFSVVAPLGGGKEPWRGSVAFQGVPREAGAGPVNRLDRTDYGFGASVSLPQLPLLTAEAGSVRKDLVSHDRTARPHPQFSEGANKVLSALGTSGGRVTPDFLAHLDAYLGETAASPNPQLRLAGERVSDVFPELGNAPYPDQLATAGGRPAGMNKAAWKALRQQLDQQARGELTPTQAHYLNLLFEGDARQNTLPSSPTGRDIATPGNPAPRPVLPENGPVLHGLFDNPMAKPLTPAEIAANRKEAASLLNDTLHQDLGMPEVTMDNLVDQLSRSPTLIGLLRDANDRGVRIVNPARRDLRISDARTGEDVTATGSQFDSNLGVIFVDAETFRAADADGNTVLAEFVDLLSHEAKHAASAAIDLPPGNFESGKAYGDTVVPANLHAEGEATFGQYVVADELAANGGKPAAILAADVPMAEIFARYKSGEIDRPQAIAKMAKLIGDKQPSTSEGTYTEFYRNQADKLYDHYTSGDTKPLLEPGQPAPANKGQPNNGLTRNGVHAVPLDQVPNLVMRDFRPDQIPWLKPEQVAELTGPQWADMDRAGLLPYVTKVQMRAVPETRITEVNIAGLVGKQVPWLTKGHIRNLTDKQTQDLINTGLSSHLKQPQWQQIKGDKVALFDMTKVDPSRIAWFKPGQVAGFTSKQFADLGKSGRLSSFTEPMVRAIPNDKVGSIDVKKLDPGQVPWLTEKQVPHLTLAQWGDFPLDHIEAFPQPLIEAVPSKLFGEMSPGLFRKFTPEQFEWMSAEHTDALSVLHMTTFRATHKKTMTPVQAAAVDEVLGHARLKENSQLLATFGGMAGTAYGIQQALPPQWAATASGVAFGVRGLVFSAQAVFPNATAGNTRLGRTLNAINAVTFVFAAPGSVNAALHGDNLWVNGTYGLGNIIFGTKTGLQVFTGRTVFRNAGEHLGEPLYVLGSAFYTFQNLDSPLAWVAGGLFTVGCSEFWASAARTDILNRKPVPRTQQESEERAKSDKRWARADRLSLGITFGVGMILFAWDSLDGEPWKTKPATPQPPAPQPTTSQSPAPPSPTSSQPPAPQTTSSQPPAPPPAPPQSTSSQPQSPPPTSRKPRGGLIAVDYVEPQGKSDSEGRTNPTLEKDGYRWVQAQSGDTIRLIARSQSVDVAQTMMLNMDHILTPDMIFSGDRIYLPDRSV